MSLKIKIRFYAQLNLFLAKNQRHTGFSIKAKHRGSVKDLIESLGVPHTEIDLVVVNGQAVEFSYQIQNNDLISVYPVFKSLDISSLQPQPKRPLHHNRFALDVHLGKLATYLRLFGFNTLYRNNYTDTELATISEKEHRILLSCDRKLLMRNNIIHGFFLHSHQPLQQLMDVFSRYDLIGLIQPFTRCLQCNGIIQHVEKATIKHGLQAKTRKYYQEFYRCSDCGNIYWKGSHYQRMKQLVDKIAANPLRE